MNEYENVTNEQLTEALDVARYHIQRYAKTRPETAYAARQIMVKVKAELKARARCSTQ